MDTFTYTARSTRDPDKSVTFTLHDQHLSIQLGSRLQPVEVIGEEEEEGGLHIQTSSWLRPLLNWLLAHNLRPFHLDDVSAQVRGDGLWLSAWYRTGGLRLLPLIIILPEVDNPDGAQDFADRLRTRRDTVDSASEFFGPFDYWATWVIGGVVMLVAVISKLRKESEA
jgi:hypothetical protein